MSEEAAVNRSKNVMVVYGRNEDARLAMFEFLRSIGLRPIEWSRARALTGEGSPYIGTILDATFNSAQAVVVLFTPDEIVNLRPEYANGPSDPDLAPSTQSRPNVLFEAGMAIGRDASRTILVELGSTRGLSDLAGRFVVRMGNEVHQRLELIERLRTAGCDVDQTGKDWIQSGKFDLPPEPDFSPRPASPIDSANTSSQENEWTRSGQFMLRAEPPKSAGFGLFTVLSEARNEGRPIRLATVTATYRDSSGRIIGSATGAVSQIDESETKTFNLNSTDDLSTATDWKLQINAAM